MYNGGLYDIYTLKVVEDLCDPESNVYLDYHEYFNSEKYIFEQYIPDLEKLIDIHPCCFAAYNTHVSYLKKFECLKEILNYIGTEYLIIKWTMRVDEYECSNIFVTKL